MDSPDGPVEESPNAGDRSLSKKDQLDRALKIGAFIISLATVLTGIFEFGYTQRLAQEAAIRESKKPFLDRQLALYFEGAELVSEIANKDWDKEDPAVLDRFWRLYWGELSLVESGAVDEAMANYGSLLELYRDHRVLTKRCMQQAALQVTHAMARSLESGWDQRANLTYKVVMVPCTGREESTPAP